MKLSRISKKGCYFWVISVRFSPRLYKKEQPRKKQTNQAQNLQTSNGSMPWLSMPYGTSTQRLIYKKVLAMGWGARAPKRQAKASSKWQFLGDQSKEEPNKQKQKWKATPNLRCHPPGASRQMSTMAPHSLNNIRLIYMTWQHCFGYHVKSASQERMQRVKSEAKCFNFINLNSNHKLDTISSNYN